jgi:hypothetical protein
MKKLLFLLFILPVIIFTSSCETDFDLTTDYKEIAVVYGLLNQNDSVQYLRINKAFLGDGNALIYSGIPDSSSFGNSIEVSMIESLESGAQRTIFFDTVTIHDKDSGYFYYPDQLMYKTEEKLNPLATYSLKIRNKNTGNEVTSVTNLIQNFALTRPAAANNVIPRLDFKRDTISMQKIEWNSAVNGRMYLPILRFYFREASFTSDTVDRVIEWVFSSLTTSDLAGGTKMSIEFRSEDFFRLCENQIPYEDLGKEEAVKTRLADHFDIYFAVAGDEFTTYLDVNGPTTGLLLEKPSYTNINNGLGVFSSRLTKTVYTRVGEKIKADLQNKTNLRFFVD